MDERPANYQGPVANIFKGLTYFNWSLTYKTTKVLNDKGEIEDKDGRELQYLTSLNENTYAHLTYDIGYYNGSYREVIVDNTNKTTIKYHAYFIFDVVYPNKTISDVNEDEEKLPPDGCIFNVNAATTTNYINAIQNAQDKETNWLGIVGGIILGALAVVVSVVAIIASGGLAAIGIAGSIGLILSAVVGVGLIVLGAFNTQFQNSLSAKSAYLEKLDQSYGFLSESYSTLINYKYENGQPIINNTDQKTIVRYGTFYTYYSSDRPNDYYERYYLYEDPTASDTTDASLTQIVLNNAGININGDDGRDLVITTSRPELPMTYTFTEDGTEHKGNIYRYYILYNGAYYKISIAAEVEYTTYQDSEYIKKQFPTVGERLTVSGSHYVRGNYNPTDNTYSYPEITDPNRKGNNLEYDKETGKFTANGETLPSDFNALYNIELNFYYDATINANVNKDNETDTTITTGSSWSEGVTYYRGYSYMKNAYYTANGQKNEEGLKKVATFSYNPINKEVGSDGLFIEGSSYWNDVKRGDYGTEGVDCFLVHVDNSHSGLDNYALYQISAVNDDYDDTAYNYYDGTEYGTVYINDDEILSYDRDKFTGADIYVNIYPESFTNPYNEKVTTIDETYLHDTNYYIVETMLTPDTERSSVSISQSATFYYYEGGYTAFEGRVYEDLDDSDDILQNIPIIVYDEDGNATSITLKELKDKWDTYKDRYLKDNVNDENKDLYKVSYSYHKDGNTFYKLSSSYVLNNGLLSIAQIITNYSSQGYNYNKFLTDDSIQLYTRYKYLTEDLELLDISKENLFKVVGFENDETTQEEDQYKFPIPPYGGTYYFTESVSVSIGGGTVYLTFADASVDEDGNPIATEVRTEINTGGVVVLE